MKKLFLVTTILIFTAVGAMGQARTARSLRQSEDHLHTSVNVSIDFMFVKPNHSVGRLLQGGHNARVVGPTLLLGLSSRDRIVDRAAMPVTTVSKNADIRRDEQVRLSNNGLVLLKGYPTVCQSGLKCQLNFSVPGGDNPESALLNYQRYMLWRELFAQSAFVVTMHEASHSVRSVSISQLLTAPARAFDWLGHRRRWFSFPSSASTRHDMRALNRTESPAAFKFISLNPKFLSTLNAEKPHGWGYQGGQRVAMSLPSSPVHRTPLFSVEARFVT